MAAVASPVDRGVAMFVGSGGRTSVVQEYLHQVVVAADGREMNRRPTQFVPGERGREGGSERKEEREGRERGREGGSERKEEREERKNNVELMNGSQLNRQGICNLGGLGDEKGKASFVEKR